MSQSFAPPRASLAMILSLAGIVAAGPLSVSAQEIEPPPVVPPAAAPDALPNALPDPAPIEPAPVEPAPVESVPVQPGPFEPGGVPPAPAGPIPAVPRSSFVPPPSPVPPSLPEDDRVPPLIDSIRERIAAEQALAGIEVSGGEVVVADLVPRRDLRIVATGGTLAGRARLAADVRKLIEAEPEWKGWLDGHGYAVIFSEPPVDAGGFVSLPPRPEEEARLVELMQLVQDRVELDSALSGALVVSGTFHGREGLDARELRIVGRLIEDEQRQALERVFVEAMAAHPYWRDMRHSVFVTFDTLRVATPSDMLAARYYAMGLDAFWAGDLTIANAAFTRAIAERPDSLVYRYWRVVVHLAACEPARAKEKLRPLVRHNIWGQQDPLIAHEFERLQGPLRWQLAIMERDILLTLEP
ncbi:MAG: hypothetical protein WD066_15195 [Planctomycetaceae bacterium]